MKKFFLLFFILLSLTQVAFAGQFQDNMGTKKYLKDDFSFAKSEWVVADVDSDGVGEYLYFDSNGFMLKNTLTPDGNKVDNMGRWVVDGVVQKVDLNVKKNEEVQNNVINNIKPIDISQTNILSNVSIEETFVDNGDNTENVKNDPNTIPPKALKAIEWIRYWCNEDGEPIIPYSRKGIRLRLEGLGYKKDIINRAISECGVDWNNHALILARIYDGKHYNRDRIRKILKAEGFSDSVEIIYAMSNLEATQTKSFVNPTEYIGLTTEEKKAKLRLLGFDEKQIAQALVFLDSIE